MKKMFYILIVFISFSFTHIFAQNASSIEVQGGIVAPMNSSKGLSGSLQYNYSFNNNISFYASGGYSSWDKHNIVFHEDLSDVQKKNYFKTYSSDDHRMIPVYIGSRINFHTTKFFSTFVNFEIGYTHLSYNSYKHWKAVDPNTGAVLGYYPDLTSKNEHQENLFGLGIGAGLSHPMSEKINLILAFKLNTYTNSGYYGIFSARGTYTTFQAGFNFVI